MGKNKYVWINALLFQVVWFTCILAPTLAAVTATLVFLGLHLKIASKPHREIKLILFTALLGFAVDLVFSLSGFIQFERNSEFPYFLLCLWLAFATTIYHSSSKLFSSDLVAIITGLLAPLSYIGAQNLGKVSYSQPLYKGIILHALLWSGIMLIIRIKFFKKEISTNA